MYVCVCLEVCDYRAFFVSPRYDEPARILGMLHVDVWKNQFNETRTHSTVEHMVDVAADRRLFLVTSVTP